MSFEPRIIIFSPPPPFFKTFHEFENIKIIIKSTEVILFGGISSSRSNLLSLNKENQSNSSREKWAHSFKSMVLRKRSLKFHYNCSTNKQKCKKLEYRKTASEQ